MKIGKYLTIDDITKSQTAIRAGIDNTPTPEQMRSIALVVQKIFDPVKDKFPEAFVSSFFRSEKLNAKIGGAKGSQHAKGEAVDIDSTIYNKAIFEFVKTLDFDQVIYEFGNDSTPDWVHVSYKPTGNRKQILRAKKVNGKTVYIPL